MEPVIESDAGVRLSTHSFAAEGLVLKIETREKTIFVGLDRPIKSEG